MLSIIIPAFNEETVIEACLDSLLQQKRDSKSQNFLFEIIVAANGCYDKTVFLCKNYYDLMAERGIKFIVLELTEGNKNNAINTADNIASFSSRLYLDADVVCEPFLVAQIITLLDVSSPRYASGTLAIQDGPSFFSRAYGKIWRKTPYIRDTIPGCGCYAVNNSGRKLWKKFPMIHSDDKFVRLLFDHSQRKQASAKYFWPLPQGFFTLLKIRIRWIHGNRQLVSSFPELQENDSKRLKVDLDFLKTVLSNPISTIVFLTIYFLAATYAYLKPKTNTIRWTRAR